MLRAKKKITKQDLKEDKLVTFLAKSESWYYEKKKIVNYSIGAVIVLAILIVVYINNRNADAQKAANELAKIAPYYETEQYEIAIKGVPEKNIMGLKQIADDYSSSKSGEFAKVYLANAYYATGKVDEALKYYEDFGGSWDVMKSAALAGEAACYESKKEPAKAAELYEKAGTKYAEVPLAPDYLTDAARLYVQTGDKERAKNLYKKIKTDFPTSPAARDVERFMAELAS